MGIIDDGKLQNILPKYSELKLSGKNLAQQYVSTFNTGMNIYQCINQLQGYIEWVIKAVNDVVVQWNEIIDSQIKDTINATKQATTEQFNVEWAKNKAQLDVEWAKNKAQLNEEIKGMVQDQFNIDWQERENAINLKIAGVSNDLSNFKTETDTKFTTTKEELTSLINTTIDNTINSIYPIGSVYISLTKTNPGTYLKGIWEQFGQGRTLIGEGTGNDGSNTMNFTAGSTGGNYEHNHTYGIKLNEYYSSLANLNLRNSDGSWQEGVIEARRNAYFNSGCQEGNKELDTQTYKLEANTSNSRTMHPYITVYFWKRVK